MRKKIWLLFFLILAGGTAEAVEYQIGSSSYFLFSKDRNVNSANRFYLPYYQYLDVDLNKVFDPSISVHVSGWGRTDFTSRGGDRGDADLLYGYVEWRDPSHARRLLRVGRQFFFGGPSGMRPQYLDGLYFKSDIAPGYGVEILGGSPVFSSIAGRGGDFVVQARNYLLWEGQAEFGIGYLHALDSNERARQDVGLDFWIAPHKKVELFGYGYYDIIGGEFADANLTAVYLPSDKWKISWEIERTVPSSLLPHTSFFSVFSTSDYFDTGVAATWFLSDRVTLDTDAKFYRYSVGGKLFRFGAEGSYLYGEDKQGRVSLGAHRLDQLESGVTELRTYTNYGFPNRLSLSLDLYGYLFDQAIRNRDFSFTAIGSVGYEIVKDLKVLGSAFYSENPHFNNEFRGLIRVTYNFGG